MTDIDTLIAELRAGLGRNQNVWHLERDELRALLDHIEGLTSERDEAREDAQNYIDVSRQQRHWKEEAEAELARLRKRVGPRGLEVVMIDGVGHYVSEAVAKELARLRAPSGEVGEMVKRLLKGQCDVDFTCAPECGCVTDREAADLIQRLAARVAEGKRVLREAVVVIRDLCAAYEGYRTRNGEDADGSACIADARYFLGILKDHSND